jgi:hypothetical protein
MRKSFHFIITKYNACLYRRVDDADEWMKHRLSLFANFCVPSIRNQTCQDFVWVIWMDEETPDDHLRAVRKVAGRENVFVNRFRGVHQIKARQIPAGLDTVILTKLDNDDALGRTFIEEVHDKVARCRGMADAFAFDVNTVINVDPELQNYSIINASQQRRRQEGFYSSFYTLVQSSHDKVNMIMTHQIGHPLLRSTIPDYLTIDTYVARVIHERNLKNRFEMGRIACYFPCSPTAKIGRAILNQMKGTFGWSCAGSAVGWSMEKQKVQRQRGGEH